MTNLKAGDRIIDHYVYKPSKTSDPVCMGTEGVITEISKYGAIYYETIHGKKGVAHPKQCELINKEEDADNYSSTPSDNQLKVGQVISVFDQAEHFIAKVDEFWDDGTVIVTRCVPRKNTKDVVAVHPKQCMPCKWEIEDNGEESEENKDHIPDTGKKVEWCECIGALVFNIKTKIHETCGKPIKHIRDLGTILNNLASGTTSINEIKTKESHARVDNVLRDGKIFQQGRRIEELGNIAESHKSCLHDSLKRFVALEEKYNALHQEIEQVKAARKVDQADNESNSLRVVTDDLLASQKIIDRELLSLSRAFSKFNNKPEINNDDIQDRLNQLEEFMRFMMDSRTRVCKLLNEIEPLVKQVNDHDHLINGMRRELDFFHERGAKEDKEKDKNNSNKDDPCPNCWGTKKVESKDGPAICPRCAGYKSAFSK